MPDVKQLTAASRFHPAVESHYVKVEPTMPSAADREEMR